MLLKKLQKNFTKIFKSPKEAIKMVLPGMTVMQGGFGLCGIPHSLITAISKNKEINNLTWVCNDMALENVGAGMLGSQNQISKFITSFITNKKTEK